MADTDPPKTQPARPRRDPEKNKVIQARYRAKKKAQAEQLAANYEETAVELERAQQEAMNLKALGSALELLAGLRQEQELVLEQASLDGRGAASDGSELDSGEPSSSSVPPVAILQQRPVLQALLPSLLLTQEPPAASRAPSAWQASDEEGAAASPGGDGSEDAGSAAMTATAAAAEGTAGARVREGGAAGQSVQDPISAAAEQLGEHMGVQLRGEAAGSGSGRHFNSARTLGSLQLSPDLVAKVQRSSAEDLQASYGRFCQRLGDLLQEYDLTGSQSVFQEMKRVEEAWALVLALVLVSQPDHLRCLMAANLGGELSEEEEAAKWDALVASLGLSAAERLEYLGIYQAYLNKVQRLRQHRQQAMQLLQEGSPAPEQLAAVGLGTLTAAYLRAWEGATSLSVQPDLEFVSALELTRDLSFLWDVVQKARVVCASAPNFTDPFRLIAAVQRAEAAAAAAGARAGGPDSSGAHSSS